MGLLDWFRTNDNDDSRGSVPEHLDYPEWQAFVNAWGDPAVSNDDVETAYRAAARAGTEHTFGALGYPPVEDDSWASGKDWGESRQWL